MTHPAPHPLNFHHLGCDMPGDITNKLLKYGVRGSSGALRHQEGGREEHPGRAGWVGQIQTRNGRWETTWFYTPEHLKRNFKTTPN